MRHRARNTIAFDRALPPRMPLAAKAGRVSNIQLLVPRPLSRRPLPPPRERSRLEARTRPSSRND